jgi:flavodoxin
MAEATSNHTARTALILYGSETGNAQEIAEELGRVVERLRFQYQVLELNSIKLVRTCVFYLLCIRALTQLCPYR